MIPVVTASQPYFPIQGRASALKACQTLLHSLGIPLGFMQSALHAIVLAHKECDSSFSQTEQQCNSGAASISTERSMDCSILTPLAATRQHRTYILGSQQGFLARVASGHIAYLFLDVLREMMGRLSMSALGTSLRGLCCSTSGAPSMTNSMPRPIHIQQVSAVTEVPQCVPVGSGRSHSGPPVVRAGQAAGALGISIIM